jgi:hypothetical protein
MRKWLQVHPREVIVLYFEELENELETYHRLVEVLKAKK